MQAKVYHIHCSLLVHTASHFVIEGHLVRQAWFAQSEFLLTIPD